MRTPRLFENGENTEPTETSPLLAPPGGSSPSANATGEITKYVNGVSRNDEEAAGDDAQDAARQAQFQGLPEAQKKLKYIVPAISIGVFLSAADQTLIVASYGKIGSDLHALNLTNWVATSYFLSLTSFQPLYGRLSDIFGRKQCLLFAYTLFGLGCVLCGLARDIYELIVARVIQGMGGGGMTTVVSIVMSDIVPLRDRGVWQGIINIVFATGSGLGAPLGGILADYIGWRWAFITQAPFCLTAFIMVALTLDLPVTVKLHWRTKIARVDFSGAILLVFAVFGLLLGLDRGSNVSWSIPITYVPLIISVVLFAAFLYVEMRIASEPFAPGHIIFDRNLLACYLCNFFSFAGWLSTLFYIPLFFQANDGISATGAGIRLLPSIIAGVSGSLFGGFVMKKTGKYLWLTVYGYSLLAIGMILIFLFSGVITQSLIVMTIGMVLCGFGNGIGVTTTLIGLLANASPKDQAVATACSYLFRSLGSVMGLSLCSTVIQQSLRIGLQTALREVKDIDKIVDNVRQSLDYVKTLEPHLRQLVRECYGRSIGHGFGSMVILAFFSLLFAFFIREEKLSH
ncbi:hypothetical protein VTO42DRAFT_5705 [Malbranchea cinnamomea]